MFGNKLTPICKNQELTDERTDTIQKIKDSQLLKYTSELDPAKKEEAIYYIKKR